MIGRYQGRHLPHADASFRSAMQARVAASLYLGGLSEGPEKALAQSMTGIQQHGARFYVVDGSIGQEPFAR